jgi:hypothetical protein
MAIAGLRRQLREHLSVLSNQQQFSSSIAGPKGRGFFELRAFRAERGCLRLLRNRSSRRGDGDLLRTCGIRCGLYGDPT